MNSSLNDIKTVSMAGLWFLFCYAMSVNADAMSSNSDTMLLHTDNGILSTMISARPLVDVAKELEKHHLVKIYFYKPEIKDQKVTVHFQNLDLKAALRAIFKKTNYAMITESTQNGTGIKVLVYSKRAGNNPIEAHRSEPRIDVNKALNASPENPVDMPIPPDQFETDPDARQQQLEWMVAVHGSQSLALVLAAAEDPDAQIQATSEQLLLNELNDVVPKETLFTLAMRSESSGHRIHALETLVDQGEPLYAQMALESALHDPDRLVQQRAQDLLQALSVTDTDPADL